MERAREGLGQLVGTAAVILAREGLEAGRVAVGKCSCEITLQGASLGGAGAKKRRGTIVGRQRASWDLTRQSDSDRAVFLIAGPGRKP